MNTPSTTTMQATLPPVSIDDKYALDKGRIYLTGTQALVRLPLLQQEMDRRHGRDTAGYISGYRGSPLGGLDLALWKAKKHLDARNIVFQPGVNEELAATAIWGTQQTNLWNTGKHDGVFGMWYGKGPGVDRSGDVLKHANSAGTMPLGGVLALAGDDHGAKSSSVAHQSEHALIAAGIPVLYPSTIQEYIDYGLHAWAMSRYSGLWVGMKCVTDVVESSASIEVDTDRLTVVTPDDFDMPEGGLGIRWPDPPLAQEARLVDYKWYAALAYVRANKLNRIVVDSPTARFGIMAAGKAYLDVRQALEDLGLDDNTCARVGIRVMKVGCVWPLDAQDARAFAMGLDEILVVEEKRQILEYALKEQLYNWREDVRPKVYGKFDERGDQGGEWSMPKGKWLLPARGELSPSIIAKALALRLAQADLPDDVRVKIAARIAVIEAHERATGTPATVTERKPWFCSGCPHNTSTRVPDGSRAAAGIGCHYMAMWMDRRTETFTQMGGEGVSWLGQMHFSNDQHLFVNLGDGTFFHSGQLAIRAAVAARANVTYKILFNDAVAMTGGQPVDGVLTVPQIAQQLVAEGVAKLVIVTDEPQKYRSVTGLPSGVTIHHRDELDRIQLQLRGTTGTTVLVYDQTCATEKRRRRKRGTYPDPARRAFINDAVCEGCGDCTVQSNCVSVEPLSTPVGTKRKINQSSCNKDFSCVKGFCPSFVTAEGAVVKRPASAAGKSALPDFTGLPQPSLPDLDNGYRVIVTGIGGTGVVTIGALLGMAAHIEGKQVTVLDITGLAQKGGAVLSHVQFANRPGVVYATRVATGSAALVIGCDSIVSASDEVLSRVQYDVTRAVINSANTPTAEFMKNPMWAFPGAQTEQAVRDNIGSQCEFIDANAKAVALLGDAIYTNPLLLGFAWQKGWLPIGEASILQAMELNAVSVEKNQLAFGYGRYLAEHGANALDPAGGATNTVPVVLHMPESLDKVVSHRSALLAAYQDEAYANRYRNAVETIKAAERSLSIKSRQLPLTKAVATNLAKLMAYKDEYEVARLYCEPAFLDKLRAQFDGEPGKDYRLTFHLAPPLLSRRDEDGHLIKRPFGSWMLPMFRLLSKLRPLRGTPLDIFGYTQERKAERQLIAQYFALVEELATTLTEHNFDMALKLASLPDQIRGFGHVKERNMAQVLTQREALLAAYRSVTTRDVA
ncbi:indolepyruvate ferredoxin oxidoreductase family protein [Noviherbaspirillum sp.]|uniref:indolepyruvate ferredoxin oxidoreductase family protein n=1 Tax=Noviherbaspirillum sp. TaxID=1926288 RepID=UPI002B4638CB|nr:indolepyruvate ferredoxin oxidoreductase family protein [Noviherbaspirillum sp.]HJV79989.1 indolepyruvate ferredoxin oxidoreductase family protein [Noviherbaspirillum sp.]